MFVVPPAASINDAVLPSHTAVVIGCDEMVMRFGKVRVKVALLVAVPPGVVTDIVPEVPLPTTAVILVDDTTVREVAAVPPKLTSVAPVKSVPVMVTVAPALPLVGVNEVMVGAGIKINPARVAVPVGAVTEIFPEVPVPTTAVIVVGDTIVNDAAVVPPNETSVTLVKLVPVIVMTVPVAPLEGVKPVMVGGKMGLFLMIDTELLLEFATARSDLPSPSKSPMDTANGPEAVVKSALVAYPILPAPVLVFLKIETVALAAFVTARSALLSPSKSPMATEIGAAPVV